MMMNPPQNRNMTAIFFKTRLCYSFTQHGYCSKGDGCGFAHGNAELRQPPPNWQEIITNSDKFGNPPQNRIPNQQLFYNGDEGCGQYQYRDNTSATMEFSEYCGHGEQQQMVVGGGNVNVGGGINSDHRSRSAFWKTRLCFKFKNTGFCPYGGNCQYAHGEAELRKLGGNTVADTVNFEAGGPSKPPLPGPAVPHAFSTQMLQQQTPNQDDKYSELKGGAINACVQVQQTHQDKKPFEWKGPKRISLIYGDWIDC